jgi:hypothetical protein
MSGPSIIGELNDLLADMPSIHAAPTVRAAWIRRKACLLRRIAEETDTPSEADEATVLAALAEQQADRIENDS